MPVRNQILGVVPDRGIARAVRTLSKWVYTAPKDRVLYVREADVKKALKTIGVTIQPAANFTLDMEPSEDLLEVNGVRMEYPFTTTYAWCDNEGNLRDGFPPAEVGDNFFYCGRVLDVLDSMLRIDFPIAE